MTTLVFVALTASFVALAEDPVEDCPTDAGLCTGPVVGPDTNVCKVIEQVRFWDGCHLDMPDHRLVIGPTGSLTLGHNASITVNELETEPATEGVRPAALKVDCGSESCGEIQITVGGSARFRDIDFSAEASTGNTEGTSIRVNATGPIVLDGVINLNGRGNNGVAGSAFFEAPTIDANNSILANGKPAGTGGTAGSITLHSTGAIDLGEATKLQSNGSNAGHIKVIAAGEIAMETGSELQSRVGNHPFCEGECAGSIKLEGSTALNANGTIDVSRVNTDSAPGGNIWMQSNGPIVVGGSAAVHLGGGSDGSSGTLRVDAESLNFGGAVHGASEGFTPAYGARISMVSINGIEIPMGASIDAGGNGENGGKISLFTVSDLTIFGSVDAGGATNAQAYLHARHGRVALFGELRAADSPAASSSPTAIRIDGCSVLLSGAASVSSAHAIDITARGADSDSEGAIPWSTAAVGDFPTLEGSTVYMRSPELGQLPTDAQLTDWFGDFGAELTWLADPTLERCGATPKIDFDGDGEAWERLGSGTTFSDCNDYDDAMNSLMDNEIAGDGIDSNCACDAPVDLENAYAGFLYRGDQPIPVECDNDGTASPADTSDPDTGLPPSDTGVTMGPSQFDTGTSGNQYAYGDPITRCGCAQGGSTRLPWVALLGLLGVVVRRRR